MKFIKNKKFKIAAFLLVMFALALFFVQGGEKPSEYLSKAVEHEKTLYSQSEKTKSKQEKVAEEEIADESESEDFNLSVDESTDSPYDNNSGFWVDDKGEYEADDEKYYPYEGSTSDSLPSENASDNNSSQSMPENTEIDGNYCYLSVRCDALLNNMSRLDKAKHSFVPSDGVIYSKRTVKFDDGESVFDVLQREMRENKIHLEFVNTPVYNSVYVEGIANLYEFDCGSGSGWIYRVNGNVPGYGCSNYKLNVGDVVEFLYTCNLGKDIE